MYLGFGGLQNVKFCKYGNVGHLFSLQKPLRLIFLAYLKKICEAGKKWIFCLPSAVQRYRSIARPLSKSVIYLLIKLQAIHNLEIIKMDKITVVLFSTVAMLVMPNIKTSSMYSIFLGTGQ